FELILEKDQNKPGFYKGEVILSGDTPEGLYAVHAWTGNKNNPLAVGKSSFLVGKMVIDFTYPSTLMGEDPDSNISHYLNDFSELGGNFLIAHGLIGKKAYFPSTICKTDLTSESSKDIVEAILQHGDDEGLPVMLSVSWDLTRNSPSEERMDEIESIMEELYFLYHHHPSLVGFYTYLEGSGTYIAPYIREFCDYAKTLNPGLLTGCAPYVDDPMLAGYLGIIESLDLIIYQGMVMASYRPDNRQKYPIRRVKDFCSLGVGAKWLQDKIAITHVELFGYLENRISPDYSTTSYENIYPELLSAATVAGSDGISFFTYSSNIYAPAKNHPEIRQSRQAVVDGMKAFDLIWDNISKTPNKLTFYFPHSDWVIERWSQSFLPALDAFRILGIPVDILPYSPALDEDYPYWPNHPNEDVLPHLLKDQKILILPDISGFKRTDSDWIKPFVEQGGVVIAFGPQIPMARASSYERKNFFGLEEGEPKTHSSIIVTKSSGSRVSTGDKFYLPNIRLPLWRSTGAEIFAEFEDGSPAVLINRYGKGAIATIVTDAKTAAEQFPELIRDIIDNTMVASHVSRVVDIVGTNENVDIAITKTDEGFRVAVINHNTYELEITLKPLNVPNDSAFQWFNLISQENADAEASDHSIKLQLPGLDFLCFEFRKSE
ncbi:MAG: alpha-amylase family protein, partial [Bacteroidota bacterium]|nr:alpha-amylase family protein [Bacteroidota bacterium]